MSLDEKVTFKFRHVPTGPHNLDTHILTGPHRTYSHRTYSHRTYSHRTPQFGYTYSHRTPQDIFSQNIFSQNIFSQNIFPQDPTIWIQIFSQDSTGHILTASTILIRFSSRKILFSQNMFPQDPAILIRFSLRQILIRYMIAILYFNTRIICIVVNFSKWYESPQKRSYKVFEFLWRCRILLCCCCALQKVHTCVCDRFVKHISNVWLFWQHTATTHCNTLQHTAT